MDKKILLLFVVFFSFASAGFSQALTGDKIIKASKDENPTIQTSTTGLNSNGSLVASHSQNEVPLANLQGIYYVGAAGSGPGGSDPHFPSFRAALDTISSNPIAGDCIFYITSNITEPYSDNRGIGLAVDPGPYTITFKPYTGVQPVITFNYPTDLNSGPSGAFVIGIPGRGNISWDSMRTTRNIIIDGSNTAGGTTRDLTLQSATNSQRNAIPLVIVGDVSDVIIKNTNIHYKTQTVSTVGNLFAGAVMVRHRNYLGADRVPHDILFENNHISANFDGVAQNVQAYGVYQTGTPLPVTYPYNITLKNNLIEGKRRAIALYRAGSHDIIGNNIVLNQNIAANTTNEAIYAVDVDTNSVVNIYNNKISKVSSMTNGTGFGNTAISIESFGTYNVYNNFIYGFELTAANPVAYVRGIRNGSANATLNASFNSIYMTDILAGGTVSYSGMYFTDGNNTVKNNIVHNAVVDFAAYCISRVGALGTLTSDNNDFYYADATNGNVGFWNTAATQTLAQWQTASSQDANSISANPLFVSSTDLHLSANTSPVVGKGTALAGITMDIDGNMRDTIPEIGAHEFPGFIPVELVSFKAAASGNSVILSWETKTETNNSYFEVEKRTENTSFESIARLTGAGTSAQPVQYSYTDINAGTGTVYYRLKQVDFDGSVNYSSEVSADLSVPTEFSLSQNYPNPFNPSTTIKFGIPADARVLLELYSVTGEKVATLIDGDLSAGYHQYLLNASNLATGVYLYRLSAGEFSSVKKLMLVK
ncbi:MAG: T9SS type A sorting domain-containing protein [Ignavibacteriales bacterium]|nr:MAG: T9SS type A sorting domain-containing protein [Ignavibacteriales bacterium]